MARYIAQHPSGFAFTVDLGHERVKLTDGDSIDIPDWNRVSNAKRVRPWLLPAAEFVGGRDSKPRLGDLSERGLRKLAGRMGLDADGTVVELIGRIDEELTEDGEVLFIGGVDPELGPMAPVGVAGADDGPELPNPYADVELSHLNKGGLVVVAETLDLDTSGSVDELITRIETHIAALLVAHGVGTESDEE